MGIVDLLDVVAATPSVNAALEVTNIEVCPERRLGRASPKIDELGTLQFYYAQVGGKPKEGVLFLCEWLA